MRSMLFVAALWSVPLLTEKAAWGADKPADLVLGKWAGSLKIGDAETTMDFEFTKDGKVEMTVLRNTQRLKYRVLHNGDLLFLMEIPNGRGGLRTVTVDVPCKVTKDRLEMTFRKHDAIPFQWPVEYKRVQRPK
jgi:hypothetical protein